MKRKRGTIRRIAQRGALEESPEKNSPRLQPAPEACQSLSSDSGCVPKAPEAILDAYEAWLQHLGPHFYGAQPAQDLTMFFDLISQVLVYRRLLFLWWRFQPGTVFLMVLWRQNRLQEVLEPIHGAVPGQTGEECRSWHLLQSAVAETELADSKFCSGVDWA